jgi:hypothetical protein
MYLLQQIFLTSTGAIVVSVEGGVLSRRRPYIWLDEWQHAGLLMVVTCLAEAGTGMPSVFFFALKFLL